MNKILALMAFIIFGGIAIWATSPLDIKSALNLSAGIFSAALITYALVALLIAVIGLVISLMMESDAARFFIMAAYMSVVGFLTTWLMSKYTPGITILGFKAEDIVTLGFSLMVTISIGLASVAMFRRHSY